jgi:hypothetical protein
VVVLQIWLVVRLEIADDLTVSSAA